MTKQTEALRMAINVLEVYEENLNSSIAIEVIQACKEALEPTVAELNDEYLRDTHVEGLSTNSKANEIIKTQHWLCLDGQMVVAQLYNLVEILNDPMKAYPHNFSTPAKGNALLFGLCQEAADEIERLKTETQEPVARINVNKRRLEFVTPMDWSNLSTVAYYPDIDLYTTPSREWQSLSGKEFVDIAKSIWGDNLGMGDGYGYTVAWASSYATIEPSSKMLLLYHAIDKALREKNNA